MLQQLHGWIDIDAINCVYCSAILEFTSEIMIGLDKIGLVFARLVGYVYAG